MKSKFTGFVVGDVELAERQYLHPTSTSTSAATSATTTTTATTATNATNATATTTNAAKVEATTEFNTTNKNQINFFI